ncbi:16398_t:CDS:2, partial [Acaulospora colombiana]
ITSTFNWPTFTFPTNVGGAAPSPTTSTQQHQQQPPPSSESTTATHSGTNSVPVNSGNSTDDGDGSSGTNHTQTGRQPTGPNLNPFPNPTGQTTTDTLTSTVTGASVGTLQDGGGAPKGLVIGLVVSLILLTALCAIAAARGQTIDGRSDVRKGRFDYYRSRRSFRPPKSSYEPPIATVEISEDASAHFTFFPQDEEIGVPVPYPLALHVPARVAKAMEERDERWQAYESQMQQTGGGHRRPTSSMTVPGSPDDLLYYSDPTRPDLLRRSSTSRRSTLQSIAQGSTLSSMDDGTTSGYGTHYNPNNRLSRVEQGSHASIMYGSNATDPHHHHHRSDVGKVAAADGVVDDDG